MEIGEESSVGNGSDRRNLLGGGRVGTKLSGPLGHSVGRLNCRSGKSLGWSLEEPTRGGEAQ